MPKITAQEIKDLGFVAGMLRIKADDSEVIGTDGQNYRCILDHIAADANKPVTGASWATYWVLGGINGIAWVTATNYKATFKTFIDGVIAVRSLIVEGRIGSIHYASVISPTKDNVQRLELCDVAAELLARRINIELSNVTGDGQEKVLAELRNQRAAYLEEAQGKDGSGGLIASIVAGVTADTGSDFASGTLVTSHFEEAA